AAIDLAAQPIQPSAERCAVLQAALRQLLRKGQRRRMAIAFVGQLDNHLVFKLPLEHLRDVGAERSVRWTEKAGAGAIADEWPALHQIDERRRDVGGARLQLPDDAAHCRSAADARQIFGIEAALALKGVVLVRGADKRADEHKSVGGGGQLRQMLANLYA